MKYRVYIGVAVFCFCGSVFAEETGTAADVPPDTSGQAETTTDTTESASPETGTVETATSADADVESSADATDKNGDEANETSKSNAAPTPTMNPVCENARCPENSKCIEMDGKPYCACLEGYSPVAGNPPQCVPTAASPGGTSTSPATETSSTAAASGHTSKSTEDLSLSGTDFSRKRARSVRIGNILFGVGDGGSWTGMAMQILGTVSGEDGFYIAGMGLAFGFGAIRFAGLLTSGIAATRLGKVTGNNFSWALFGAGMGVGVARGVGQAILMNTSNSLGAMIGVTAGTWVVQDILWIMHCVRATSQTERYRGYRASNARPSYGYAILPVIDPTNEHYGLAMSLVF